MSIDLANHRKSRPGRPLWSGTAFLVEALLLLVFLAASLAVFAQLFAAAAGKTAESDQLARAVAAADNVAEQFAANPHAVSTVNEIDEPRDGGVLHKATITVYERSTAEATGSVSTGDSVFSVSTARYESEVER